MSSYRKMFWMRVGLNTADILLLGGMGRVVYCGALALQNKTAAKLEAEAMVERNHQRIVEEHGDAWQA